LITADQIEEKYFAGYAAFESGDYRTAVSLASECIAGSAPDSYWHFGALGLRCWVTNFLRDNTSVENDAHTLLRASSGVDKPWFDGLAVYNLGLVQRRIGQAEAAKVLFERASRRYAAYEIRDEQPQAWKLVNQFFVAVTYWAACGDISALDELGQFLHGSHSVDTETGHLVEAVNLYLRRAKGEDVSSEAEAAVSDGVSRAFLAHILLEKNDLPANYEV